MSPFVLIHVRLVDRHGIETHSSRALKVFIDLQVVKDVVLESHVAIKLRPILAQRHLLRWRVPRLELHRVHLVIPRMFLGNHHWLLAHYIIFVLRGLHHRRL